MDTRTLKILSVVEVLFFIVDVSMRRSALYISASFQTSSGLLAQYFSRSSLLFLFIFLTILLVVFLRRAMIAHARGTILALCAIILGMTSTILDILFSKVIIDWIHIGSLAFNIGDVFIVGGIISLIWNAKLKMQNVE